MHARIELCRKYNAAHKDRIAAYQRKYRQENKEKIITYGKAYRQGHKQTASEYNKVYRQKHREWLLDLAKRSRLRNKERDAATKHKIYLRNRARIIQKSRLYYQQFKPEILKKQKIYQKSYYQKIYSDPVSRAKLQERKRKNSATPKGIINQRMRAGIGIALRKRGGKRGRPWEKLVGYTAEDLKLAIEKAFRDGMNWGALLRGEIHIDHVIPQSKFNYESVEDIEFKRCWALENLAPRWKADNLSKGNRIEGASQIPIGI